MTEQEPSPELLQIQEILTLCFECELVTDHPELLLVRTPFYLPDGTGIDLTLDLLTNVLSDGGETLRWLEQEAIHSSIMLYDAIAWICHDSGLKRVRGYNHINVEVNISELMEYVLVLSLACMRIACLADRRMLPYKPISQLKGSKLDLLRMRNEAEAGRARKRRRTELEEPKKPDLLRVMKDAENRGIKPVTNRFHQIGVKK